MKIIGYPHWFKKEPQRAGNYLRMISLIAGCYYRPEMWPAQTLLLTHNSRLHLFSSVLLHANGFPDWGAIRCWALCVSALTKLCDLSCVGKPVSGSNITLLFTLAPSVFLCCNVFILRFPEITCQFDNFCFDSVWSLLSETHRTPENLRTFSREAGCENTKEHHIKAFIIKTRFLLACLHMRKQKLLLQQNYEILNQFYYKPSHGSN